MQRAPRLGGLFPYWKQMLQPRDSVLRKCYPEPFFSFPLPIILVSLASSVFKLATPFALEHLYKNVSSSFGTPFLLFLLVTGCSYWLERESERLLSLYKL